MSIRKIVAASLIALSGVTAAVAATSATTATPDAPKGHHHFGPPVSVERFAMENILVEKLSQQTGKSAADIQALMEKGGPRELAKSLNLDEATMKSTFESARATLIERATDAQLITAAQAAQIKAEPEHFGHRPPPPPDGAKDDAAN